MASGGVKACCRSEKSQGFVSKAEALLARLAWLLAKLSSFRNLRRARYARSLIGRVWTPADVKKFLPEMPRRPPL
jgi:hypothetical protein